MPATTSGITMTPASRAGRVRKIIGVTLMVIGLAFNAAHQPWNLIMHRGLHTPLTPAATLFILSAFLMIPGGLISSGADVRMLQKLKLKAFSPTPRQMCCTCELFVRTNQLWGTYS